LQLTVIDNSRDRTFRIMVGRDGEIGEAKEVTRETPHSMEMTTEQDSGIQWTVCPHCKGIVGHTCRDCDQKPAVNNRNRTEIMRPEVPDFDVMEMPIFVGGAPAKKTASVPKKTASVPKKGSKAAPVATKRVSDDDDEISVEEMNTDYIRELSRDVMAASGSRSRYDSQMRIHNDDDHVREDLDSEDLSLQRHMNALDQSGDSSTEGPLSFGRNPKYYLTK